MAEAADRARGLKLGLYGLTLVAGFGLVLYHGLPGHLSVDSVLALREGRLGLRDTWNPAFFGWLLGAFDRASTGTGLYVTAVVSLLFGGWAALAALRPRLSWLAPLAVAAAAATPQVLIYPAIVWKDVAFAVTAVAGFVVLAFAVQTRGRAGLWTGLATAAVLFAAAGLFRQNGLIAAAAAAAALAWARSGSGWGRSLGLATGWIVAVGLLTLTLSAVAQPQGAGRPDDAGARGIAILQTYDLVGAATLDRNRPLPALEKRGSGGDGYIRGLGADSYSPQRVDTLKDAPAGKAGMAALPPDAVQDDWLHLITHDPGVYLKVRAEVFRWVVATPVIDRCLPVHVGVAGPAGALEDLGMVAEQDRVDVRLYNYVTWFMDTPAMSHLAYGGLAAAVALLLLLRRDPADIAMIGLMLAGLGFAASFFAISIACDYRYLYFLDLAAITGAIYLAVDPRLRRRA